MFLTVVSPICKNGGQLSFLQFMKSPLNRTSLIFGSIILALMVIDGLIQLRAISGLSQSIQPNSITAIFLIGLTIGVISGIGMFFAHMIRRRKVVDEETRELDLLLEEISMTEDDDFSFSEDSMVDEKVELSDPWERPADWWMNADDD